MNVAETGVKVVAAKRMEIAFIFLVTGRHANLTSYFRINDNRNGL
jgi:hypothetical protein